MKHWETHPSYVEGCFACKITAVSVSATCTPGRSSGAINEIANERHQAEDMAAYKRLRADGLQPPHIEHCKVLERHAEHEKQIQMGKLHDPKLIKQADTISRDYGMVGI